MLLTDANLNHAAQISLPVEISLCFTESDKAILLSPPTLQNMKETVSNSNLHAAPGTEGIPSFIYKECWNNLGEALTYVMPDIHHCKSLSNYQRTSLVVFRSKQTKKHGILPRDNGRILLQDTSLPSYKLQ